MATDKVIILGPFKIADKDGIDKALTGKVTAADNITCWTNGGDVYFAIIKA